MAAEIFLILVFLWQSDSQVDDLLPDDFPRGPWPSAEAAKADINIYCIDPRTGGGGWAISWHGLNKRYYPVEEWRRIGCANRHNAFSKGVGLRPGRLCNGSGCQWFVKLRKEADEWTLYNGKVGHNHPLAIATDGLPVRASLRAGIPAVFMTLGGQLQNAAMPAGAINDILMRNACALGIAVSWNKADVRAAFLPTEEDRFIRVISVVQVYHPFHFSCSTPSSCMFSADTFASTDVLMLKACASGLPTAIPRDCLRKWRWTATVNSVGAFGLWMERRHYGSPFKATA